jgi:uncharacterized protein (TIGR02246 family)
LVTTFARQNGARVWVVSQFEFQSGRLVLIVEGALPYGVLTFREGPGDMRWTLAFMLSAALAAGISDLATASEEDKAAVTAVIERNVTGFRDFDAQRVSSTYAENADWTNAFGVRQRGREQIRSYLTRLFETPQFRTRAPGGGSTELTIKLVRPDVAVAHRITEIVGQKGPNNEDLPPRKIHRLLVLTKNTGEWLIESELVMDARQDRLIR